MHASAICDARAFGAKGDGVTKDTAALQRAIDTCVVKGGTVQLTAGKYLSAPIVLKSNVTLQLDKGATLLGSPDHGDYPAITMFHLPDLQGLVSATNATNVAITGEGTIDGNGESWWQEARSIRGSGILGSAHPRPKLILFDHCKMVRIEGVTIQNSPMWQVVPYYSDNVVIHNVRILAPQHSPNTDAIDPFSSSNILIDHVYSDVGDDNVAIKSGAINSPGPDDPSRNITITDCTFMHGHGLSIGSELSGGAENIRAERISFEGTDNGIRVKSNRDRGHDVGNLMFRDITMKDVKNRDHHQRVLPEGDAACGRSGEAGRTTDAALPRHRAGECDGDGGGAAAVIVGLPESPVKNVVLKNVKISAETGMTIGYAEVTGEGVVITTARGEAITKLAGARVAAIEQKLS